MTRGNVCVFAIVCLYWVCLSHVSAATTEDKTLESLRQLYGSRDPPNIIGSNASSSMLNTWPTVGPELEPKSRDLRAKKLKKKLGRDFDLEWMSIDEPDQQPVQETTVVPESLRNEVKELDFSYVNDAGEQVTLDEQTIGQMQSWLTQKATCPIQYRWIYLGKVFWPSWIKVGQCAGQTCSWPEGMTCEAGKNSQLQLLYWYCNAPKKGKTKQNPPGIIPSREKRGAKDGKKKEKKKKSKKCNWIKVPYPVTSECTCKCKDKK